MASTIHSINDKYSIQKQKHKLFSLFIFKISSLDNSKRKELWYHSLKKTQLKKIQLYPSECDLKPHKSFNPGFYFLNDIQRNSIQTHPQNNNNNSQSHKKSIYLYIITHVSMKEEKRLNIGNVKKKKKKWKRFSRHTRKWARWTMVQAMPEEQPKRERKVSHEKKRMRM